MVWSILHIVGMKDSVITWDVLVLESWADPCIFIQVKEGTKIINVYVDDLILIAKTLDELQQMKESLSETFWGGRKGNLT